MVSCCARSPAISHLRNKRFMICCGIAASFFLQFANVLGVTLCMVNFDVGETLFHFRVTTSRPVVAASLCMSKGCDEYMRSSAAVSERCNCWVRVCLFSFIQSVCFVELFVIEERSQHSLSAECFS